MKINEYPRAKTTSSDDLFLVDTIEGTKTILAEDLANDLHKKTTERTLFEKLGIFRMKFLGNTVSEKHKKAIKDGTFEDLYLGDYWFLDFEFGLENEEPVLVVVVDFNYGRHFINANYTTGPVMNIMCLIPALAYADPNNSLITLTAVNTYGTTITAPNIYNSVHYLDDAHSNNCKGKIISKLRTFFELGSDSHRFDYFMFYMPGSLGSDSTTNIISRYSGLVFQPPIGFFLDFEYEQWRNQIKSFDFFQKASLFKLTSLFSFMQKTEGVKFLLGFTDIYGKMKTLTIHPNKGFYTASTGDMTKIQTSSLAPTTTGVSSPKSFNVNKNFVVPIVFGLLPE